MRFNVFHRRDLRRGTDDFIAFNTSHFHEAGFNGFMSIGMPVLEAYQLVNKWNAKQAYPQAFVYYL